MSTEPVPCFLLFFSSLCCCVAVRTTPLAQTLFLLVQPRKVCISMDDSVNSQHALEWMEKAVLRKGDEVHVVVVALPVPYPVSAFLIWSLCLMLLKTLPLC